MCTHAYLFYDLTAFEPQETEYRGNIECVKKHNTVWSWCLINLNPLNIKNKFKIIRTVYVYAFLACWLCVIIVGVKHYFLELELGLGLGLGLWLGYIVFMISAVCLCIWSSTNFKLHCAFFAHRQGGGVSLLIYFITRVNNGN